MRFEDREIVLKNGRKCILRPTSPEYAVSLKQAEDIMHFFSMTEHITTRY